MPTAPTKKTKSTSSSKNAAMEELSASLCTKVEQVIRDDYLIESYELLEMYCSLLSTRFGLIEAVKFVGLKKLFLLVTRAILQTYIRT